MKYRFAHNKIRHNICEANILYATAYFTAKLFHSPQGEFH